VIQGYSAFFTGSLHDNSGEALALPAEMTLRENK
jgi:hypothetical protein